MTGAAWLSIALFFALALALMLGLPVALTLAGVLLLFAGIGIATGTFDPVFLDAFPNRAIKAHVEAISPSAATTWANTMLAR